jgi:hypothetical protein
MEMPLSVEEIVYQVVLDPYVDLDPVSSQMDEEDIFLHLVSATSSFFSHDCLDDTLPSHEEILESMNGPDRPWDYMYHHYYFLLELVRIKQDDFRSTLSEIVGHTIVPLDMHDIYVVGNMVSISPTIMIDISHVLGKIEDVYIDVDFSPEETQIYTDLLK